MLFNSSADTIFVDIHSPHVETEKMLDIILSPAYYWVKRQSLPVRYLREVKKLLPSLFEDTLPEGRYSYTAYREGEEYLLFAYNDRFILDRLQEKGIKASQIRNVYFAQSELDTMEVPLRIDDENLMIIHNGIVVKLPSQLATVQSRPFDVTYHKCSPHAVTLARYAHIADRRSMIRFGVLMAVLTLLVAVEWGIVAAKSKEVESKRFELFAQYDLKSTTMQNEAILKGLEADYRIQSALRDVTAKLLALRLERGEYMARLEVKGALLKVSFTLSKPERAKAIVAELKKEGMVPKERFDGNHLELEVAL